MSNTSIEQMKKIIADKKKKSSEQGSVGNTESKWNASPAKGFKKTKRAGSLNK